MKFIIHSYSTTGNFKPTNEDTLDIINNLDTPNQAESLYVPILYAGLFDGHGGDGVSKALINSDQINIGKYFTLKKSQIAENLSQSKKYNKKAIVPLFQRIQEKLKNYYIHSNTMGSTALISLIYPKSSTDKLSLKIINLGDSRAVIANEYNIGNALNLDHKPHLLCESKRIQQIGGTLEFSEGDDPRINGMSVSRSFGDLDNKYISQIPDIFDYTIESEKFIIMGCDGVWDVLSNQDAVDHVLLKFNELKTLNKAFMTLKGKPKNNINIAYELSKYAIDKGSKDNITVIIIFFTENMSKDNTIKLEK